jgi:hypothetical protein
MIDKKQDAGYSEEEAIRRMNEALESPLSILTPTPDRRTR